MLEILGRSSSLYDEKSEKIPKDLILNYLFNMIKNLFSHLRSQFENNRYAAAFGLAQLEKLDNFIKIEKKILKFISKFKNLEEYFILPESLKDLKPLGLVSNYD